MILLSYFLAIICIMMESCSCLSTFVDVSNEGAIMSCNCGKDVWEKEIGLKYVVDILGNIVDSNLVSTSILYYPEIIRNRFLKCSMCKVSISKCLGGTSNERYTCKERLAEFVIYKNESIYPEYRDMLNYAVKNITSYLAEYDGSPAINILNRKTIDYPFYDHIPIGGLKKTRAKRYGDACKYPTSLQISDLACIHYPKNVRCIQRCAFLHTLKEGTKLKLKCNKKENKWYPHNFEECQPYVDCTLSLVSGGKAKCTVSTLTKGPVCEIECDKFQNNKGVHTKNHECDIDGNWSPSLPFCAVPGTGIHLEKAPKY